MVGVPDEHHLSARHPTQLRQALRQVPVVHPEHGHRRVEGAGPEREHRCVASDPTSARVLAEHHGRRFDGHDIAPLGLVGPRARADVEDAPGPIECRRDHSGQPRVGAAGERVVLADAVVGRRTFGFGGKAAGSGHQRIVLRPPTGGPADGQRASGVLLTGRYAVRLFDGGPGGTVTVTGMANLAVKVVDLDAAVAFYEAAGAQVRDRMHWNNGERADVLLGPVMITLFTKAIYEESVALPPEGFLHPALFTDDLDAELQGHDVIWGPAVVEGTFGTRRIAFVTAPGGIRLEFMEQIAPPPTPEGPTK